MSQIEGDRKQDTDLIPPYFPTQFPLTLNPWRAPCRPDVCPHGSPGDGTRTSRCTLHDPVHRTSGDLEELGDLGGGVLASLI